MYILCKYMSLTFTHTYVTCHMYIICVYIYIYTYVYSGNIHTYNICTYYQTYRLLCVSMGKHYIMKPYDIISSIRIRCVCATVK